MGKIKIERAMVDGIKADFVKGEVKVTLRMPLETGLSVRSELAGYADMDQPVTVEIRAWQSRLPMMGDVESVTLTKHGGDGEVNSVTLKRVPADGQEESNGDVAPD